MAIENHTNLSNLGERLRWARKARGMSQVALSRATKLSGDGVSHVAIWKLEAGASLDIKAGTLFKLAAALEVNPDWLRDGSGEPFELTPPVDAVTEAARLLANLSPDKQAMILAAIKAISTP